MLLSFLSNPVSNGPYILVKIVETFKNNDEDVFNKNNNSPDYAPVRRDVECSVKRRYVKILENRVVCTLPLLEEKVFL